MVSVHLITSCQGFMLAGNKSETFISLLHKFLNLAIHAEAPVAKVYIMLLLLNLQRAEYLFIHFQGTHKYKNSYISLNQLNQAYSYYKIL